MLLAGLTCSGYAEGDAHIVWLDATALARNPSMPVWPMSSHREGDCCAPRRAHMLRACGRGCRSCMAGCDSSFDDRKLTLELL